MKYKLNYVNCIRRIICKFYQSNPKGFIIGLDAVSSIGEENFKVEGTPLHIGLQPDWKTLYDDARKLVYDVDLVSMV